MSWSIEGVALTALLIAFAGILGVGWEQAMGLRQTIADNATMVDIDPNAVVEIEKLKRVADSQIDNSRTYFLMGSSTFFERQKEDRQTFEEKLTEFEKQYSLPQIPEILARIGSLRKQEQEFFDQAVKFREEKTESKIVGQFYNSKTASLLRQIHENLDEAVKLHVAAVEAARTRARQAGAGAQALVPEGMRQLSLALAGIVFGLTILILKMLAGRRSYLRERGRLVDAAKKALLARDEVLAAVSADFKEPLQSLNGVAENLRGSEGQKEVLECVDFIKGTALEMQGLLDDIYDQKKTDMGEVALRIDQLPVGDILEEAQMILQPLAKKNDVTLHIESVNPSVLAFADKERVLRVMINLVGNSIKFTRKHSKIAIKARSDQQFVYVSVVDAGPGIPESRLATVFDDFWQARKTTDQGPGIGLSVVKSVIEAHGGTVLAERNLSGGTTFTFSLPRRRPAGIQLKKSSVRVVKRAPLTEEIRAEGPGI